MDRQGLANLWRDATQITREDIFGPDDELLPLYPGRNGELAQQARIPAVGMVGPNFHGTLAILSVNGAGGKAGHQSIPSSDRMYARIRELQEAEPGPLTLGAFEALNAAVMGSMPDWGVTQQHTKKILGSAKHKLDEVAYLYVVPFRTKDDAGSKMPSPYLDAGYTKHLVHQLRALRPALIIAIDRPSEKAAHRFRAESPVTEVIYYTRKRDAHDERKKTLAEIARMFKAP